jgi:hypothetical protein
MPVTVYQAKECYIPRDLYLEQHWCENPKSHNTEFVLRGNMLEEAAPRQPQRYSRTSHVIVARIVDWTNKICSIWILNFYSLVNKAGFEVFVWCGKILLLLGKVIAYLSLCNLLLCAVYVSRAIARP